jgi:hypothetical protein
MYGIPKERHHRTVKGDITALVQVTLHHQLGSSAARSDYLPISDPLSIGASLLFGSNGRPSEGAFPSFVLHTGNTSGLAVMVGWSGSWFANISRSTAGVRLVVRTGRLSAVLNAGESVQIGRVVALPYEAGLILSSVTQFSP